jgi:hypothetical protein
MANMVISPLMDVLFYTIIQRNSQPIARAGAPGTFMPHLVMVMVAETAGQVKEFLAP